jgi:hypothetical protein
MVPTHATGYVNMMNATAHYEVLLVHGTRNPSKLHWLLLVKMKESDLPHITFEVTTKNMTDLIQTTRNVRPDGTWIDILSKDPEKIDIYVGSLHGICRLADEVVKEMGTYSLTRRNCQHFCNLLLIKMKIRTTPFPTTFGTDTAEPDDARSTFDCFSVVLQSVIDTAIDIAPNAVVAGTTALAKIVGAPTPHTPDPLSNLKPMYRILKPLAPKWKEIGGEIIINKEALNKIEIEQGGNQLHCLREMLREYLLDPEVDSFETLADAVAVYNSTMSEKIHQLTPDVQVAISTKNKLSAK